MDNLKPIQKSESPPLSSKTEKRVQGILKAGTAENTRLAYSRDLEYFQAWARFAFGRKPALPFHPDLLVQFVTDHLGGLDEEVDKQLVAEGLKAKPGPHSPNTVKRRLAALSVAHDAAGVQNPCRRPEVRLLLSKARKARVKAGMGPRKKRAATLDLIEALLSTCVDETADIRDRALIAVGFASGGRRRSELENMTLENLVEAPEGYVYTLPRSKTDQEGKGQHVPIIGRAATYLEAWLYLADIREGPIFRRVSKGGKVLAGGLSGYGIAKIIKKRAGLAGFNPDEFAGHSLRSGFITETGRQGRSLADAMAMSGHRSTAVALDYHQAAAIILNPCARVMEREKEQEE